MANNSWDRTYVEGDSLTAEDVNGIVGAIKQRVEKSNDTFTGKTVATPSSDEHTAQGIFTEAQIRNIIIASFTPEEGVEPIGQEGDIWLKYD